MLMIHEVNMAQAHEAFMCRCHIEVMNHSCWRSSLKHTYTYFNPYLWYQYDATFLPAAFFVLFLLGDSPMKRVRFQLTKIEVDMRTWYHVMVIRTGLCLVVEKANYTSCQRTSALLPERYVLFRAWFRSTNPGNKRNLKFAYIIREGKNCNHFNKV